MKHLTLRLPLCRLPEHYANASALPTGAANPDDRGCQHWPAMVLSARFSGTPSRARAVRAEIPGKELITVRGVLMEGSRPIPTRIDEVGHLREANQDCPGFRALAILAQADPCSMTRRYEVGAARILAGPRLGPARIARMACSRVALKCRRNFAGILLNDATVLWIITTICVESCGEWRLPNATTSSRNRRWYAVFERHQRHEQVQFACERGRSSI